VAFLLSVTLHGAAQSFQHKTIQFQGAADYSDQEMLASATNACWAQVFF
jgi:hypothetical protein